MRAEAAKIVSRELRDRAVSAIADRPGHLVSIVMPLSHYMVLVSMAQRGWDAGAWDREIREQSLRLIDQLIDHAGRIDPALGELCRLYWPPKRRASRWQRWLGWLLGK